jgi:hypothetical protein
MPGIETLVGILSLAMTIIAALGGIVWNMLRQESKEQSELIKEQYDLIGTKVDMQHVKDVEQRWKSELTVVRESSDKVIEKLSQRHDRELDQLSTRLSEQMRTVETNILTQIRLMVQVLETTRKP